MTPSFLSKLNIFQDFVGINRVKNNIDTTTPMGMVLFSMSAAFAEMERELIRERVIAGLDAAHKKGRKGGRPRALNAEKSKMLMSLIKTDEFSVKKICEMVGISKSVYYRALKQI